MARPRENEEKLNEIAKYTDDKETFTRLLAKYFVERENELADYYEENPTDAPNDVLNFAIIEGIGFNADQVLAVGDFMHLFSLGQEKFFIWVPEKNRRCLLVAQVDPSVKQMNLWKTGASILQAAYAFASQLEDTPDFGYDWIYRFSPNIQIGEQHYLKDREYAVHERCIYTVTAFKHISNVIELLVRDDKFYVATQNLIAATFNHYFCHICALTPEKHRQHREEEPEIWEKITMIPKMEAAIVQATRAVEALLGKPAGRDDPKKLQRTKGRWMENIDLNPDNVFDRVETSYLEYYYDLFSLRGSAAHSLGNLSYDLTRKLAIDAQSFALVVIRSYFKKHSLNNESAARILNLNNQLLERFPTDFSSTMTAEN